MFTVAHTLENTICQMYRLMHAYRSDVASLGWRSVSDVFSAVKALPYTRDHDAQECLGHGECVKRPGITLATGGDCDDKVIVAGAALLNLGIPFRVVTTGYQPDGEMQHTYLEVFVEGRWRPFDATYPHNQLFVEAPYTAKQVWE